MVLTVIVSAICIPVVYGQADSTFGGEGEAQNGNDAAVLFSRRRVSTADVSGKFNLLSRITNLSQPTAVADANDGGFESNTGTTTVTNPFWTSTSTAFGTSFCTVAACGTGGGAAAPRTGNGWVWFDGTGSGTTAENGTVQQSIVFPSGGTLRLNYYLRIGTVSAPSSSVMTVSVDGTVVQTVNEPATAEAAYTLRAVDLTPFANGATRVLRFAYSRPAGTTGSDSFTIDDVTLTPNAPTAGTVQISGRALTASGRGIRNVAVTLTDSTGGTRTAKSNAFGAYRFVDVAAGETYIITAKGRRYTFSQPSQVLNVGEDAANVNFTANP